MENYTISKIYVKKSRSPMSPLECLGMTETDNYVYIRFRNNTNSLKVIVGWVPLEHSSDTSTVYEFSVPNTEETRRIGEENDRLLEFLQSHLQDREGISISENTRILDNMDEDIRNLDKRIRLHLKSM